MDGIEVFKNEEFGEVRTRVINDVPMFVGKDVAMSLGYTNPMKAIRDHVDEEDKGVNEMFTPGGNQQVMFINESGVYSLVFSSKLPDAKKFKHWVTSEVLPAIRKTGGYMVSKQDDTPESIMARAVLIAQDTIKRQEHELDIANERISLQDAELKKQAPKVEYVDNVLKSVSTYTSTQMSKELGLRTGKQLHEILNRLGYMYKQSGQWMLTSKFSELGYTKSRTNFFTLNDGSLGTNIITVWTEKGRQWLHDLHNNSKF